MDDTVTGRIHFLGNPWPNGHRIKSLRWGAIIRPNEGLSLDFTLESADYYEEEKQDVERDAHTSDWDSPAVWSNYHACTIEPSTTSGAPCLPVSDGTTRFEFDAPSYAFAADPLPIDDIERFFETNAFSIYLLGHDAVADHRINLTRTDDAGHYDLHWTGRIALAYAGESEFRHSFEARASGVRFEAIDLQHFDPTTMKKRRGVDIDPNIDPRDCIAPYVSDPDRFIFERRGGVLYAVRRYE